MFLFFNAVPPVEEHYLPAKYSFLLICEQNLCFFVSK